MSNLSEIIDRLERVGQGEGAHALRHVRDVAEQRQADLVAKDDRIRDYMNICEDLSRKLEEARMRIGELEKTGQYGETKSDQAYQVIGTLATIANCFQHPEVIRALDYFGSDRFDPEFLPFRSPAMIKAEKEQGE